MRMLRWMCGVIELVGMRNDRIRGNNSWANRIKVHERRLKWYDHVMRMREHYLGKRANDNEEEERN